MVKFFSGRHSPPRSLYFEIAQHESGVEEMDMKCSLGNFFMKPGHYNVVKVVFNKKVYGVKEGCLQEGMFRFNKKDMKVITQQKEYTLEGGCTLEAGKPHLFQLKLNEDGDYIVDVKD